MGKTGLIVIVAVVLAGCQSMLGFENVNAASSSSPEVSEARPALRSASKAPVPAQPVTEVAVTPVQQAPLPILHTDADSVMAGIVIPPLASTDSRQAAFTAEKVQVDQLVLHGSLTREAGAKRLYRFATKEGIAKGKADEDFWQSLIRTYRNLDDHFISAEDAASDINAAAERRAAAVK